MSNAVDGQITEQELDRLRARLGEVVKVSDPPYLTEATSDAIRRWAQATGDRNRLYHDPDYAATTRFGSVIAPPCLPYALSRLSIGYRGGLPGVHSMFGGSHWKWFEPLPEGAKTSSETRFTDLVELSGQFSGRMFKQVSTTTFTNAGTGRPFAEIQGWGMRTERQSARKRGKYNDITSAKTSYDRDALAAIAEEYAAERPRGADVLHWNDVAVDAAVPSIIRGPYSPTSAVAFEQAWGGLFIHAHGFWFDFLREHPAIGLSNAFGVPEPPEAVHWDGDLARRAGVPDAYDYGPERISWLSVMLTNWIGDHGFLEELYAEIRGFNLMGDLSRCHGTVEGKTEPDQDGNGRVRVRIWITNQRDQTTAKGWAVVRLPAGSAP
ncbi:FAS1-like dehydratase domain-containing protein [Actinophytocola sp.]|uniref:FAS1-like dehydratase domain-containing protein n=1 Tax=Actinophytocola sp. TaxID=1872138 RepID=UPI003D6AF46A